MHLHDLTIKKFHEGLLSKQFSAAEVTKAYFEEIEAADKNVGAYLSLMKDQAYLSAEQADLKIQKSEATSMLAGVPMAIKDNILIKGFPATAASKILEHYTASYDATVIKKLSEANAVFLGKTNLDEFAMGSSTENSAFKITRNPHDLERVPGGSSGGSAAAVAGNLSLAALGSDTGGSIRQPAGFCGVVGLKPTYGAVSRFGLIAMASSLDQIGPFTKTVEDAAYLLDAIQGHDFYDATSKKVNLPSADQILNYNLDDIKKLRIGVPKEYFVKGLQPEVKEAIDGVIKRIGSFKVEIKEISLPHTQYALACYYIIMPAEVSANVARFDGIRYAALPGVARDNLLEVYKKTRDLGFGTEVKRRIILGTFVLSSGYYDAYYSKAQKVRRLIKNDFDSAFKDVDIILTPVSPTPPFKFGEKMNDPLAMYLSDIFTIPVNLAGLPAISIPVREHKGVPIGGFQLIGKPWRETDILRLGDYYEKSFQV